jgi:hypothetical protein
MISRQARCPEAVSLVTYSKTLPDDIFVAPSFPFHYVYCHIPLLKETANAKVCEIMSKGGRVGLTH